MFPSKKKSHKDIAGPSNQHQSVDPLALQNIEGDLGSSMISEPPASDPRPEGSRSRSGRLRTFPSRFKDFLPVQPIPLAHASQPAAHEQPDSSISDPEPSYPPSDADLMEFKTAVNEAGIFRVYPVKPTSNPDFLICLDDVSDSPNFAVDLATLDTRRDLFSTNGILLLDQDSSFYSPFLSASVYRLMSWFYCGGTVKSLVNLHILVCDVINAPDFDVRHFGNFSVAREAK